MTPYKQYTKEECREKLIRHFMGIAHYWKKQYEDGKLHEDQCPFEGMLHSILVTFDGESAELPAFDITTSPHEDDMEYHMSRLESWWPERLCINDDIHLHDLMYEMRNKK
jgi:hypothetical protein